MKIIKKTLKFLILLIIFLFIFILSLYLYAYFMPKTIIKKANTYYLYDINNKLVYQGSSSNKWVKVDNVSKYYLDAVISIEDKNFYKHNGFDYTRIIKASIKNVYKGKIVEGASTISQQYIKNLYQNFNKTIKRKMNETLLTLNLETHYSKDEILEGYINTINFGQGNIGIYNASKFYFNKEPKNLTLEESIILAGIPKSPNNFNPVTDYDKCINRAKIVLNSMVKNKKISKDKAKRLFKNKIEIYGRNDKEDLNMLMYYQDAVMDELKNKINIPDEVIKRKGIKIFTNLDIDIQKDLEKNIYNYMNGESMQVASVVINPKSGGVLALTGGLDYSTSQFNRAIKAKRQVGSTIKPFLYYTALENGLTSSSKFSSEPTTFTMENNKTYSPKNYGNMYANKEITMASAIALSDNIFAVKTNMFLGGDKLINTLNLAGVKDHFKDIPSLPLGTIELSMIDYAQGYQTLANEGILNEIHFINKIEDFDGNTIYEFKNEPKTVLNYNYTYIISEMLSNTYNDKFIDYTKPTALIIKNKLDEKYAIKTGTTKTDFWTVGYNKNKLMLTWIGNDDSSEVQSSKSFISKNIFADTMKNIKSSSNSWYEQPKNVISLLLNPTSGELEKNTKNTTPYYFVKGSEISAKKKSN